MGRLNQPRSEGAAGGLPEAMVAPLTLGDLQGLVSKAVVTSQSQSGRRRLGEVGEAAARMHNEGVRRITQALTGEMNDVLRHVGKLEFHELILLRTLLRDAIKVEASREIEDAGDLMMVEKVRGQVDARIRERCFDLDLLHRQVIKCLARYQPVEVEVGLDEIKPTASDGRIFTADEMEARRMERSRLLKGLLLVYRGMLNTTYPYDELERRAAMFEVESAGKGRGTLLVAGDIRVMGAGAYVMERYGFGERDETAEGVGKLLESAAGCYGAVGDYATMDDLHFLAEHRKHVADYLEKFFKRVIDVVLDVDVETKLALSRQLHKFLTDPECDGESAFHMAAAAHLEGEGRWLEAGRHRLYQCAALIREGARLERGLISAPSTAPRNLFDEALISFRKSKEDYGRDGTREALPMVIDAPRILDKFHIVVDLIRFVG